jgi:hypothetical protein
VQPRRDGQCHGPARSDYGRATARHDPAMAVRPGTIRLWPSRPLTPRGFSPLCTLMAGIWHVPIGCPARLEARPGSRPDRGTGMQAKPVACRARKEAAPIHRAPLPRPPPPRPPRSACCGTGSGPARPSCLPRPGATTCASPAAPSPRCHPPPHRPTVQPCRRFLCVRAAADHWELCPPYQALCLCYAVTPVPAPPRALTFLRQPSVRACRSVRADREAEMVRRCK